MFRTKKAASVSAALFSGSGLPVTPGSLAGPAGAIRAGICRASELPSLLPPHAETGQSGVSRSEDRCGQEGSVFMAIATAGQKTPGAAAEHKDARS